MMFPSPKYILLSLAATLVLLLIACAAAAQHRRPPVRPQPYRMVVEDEQGRTLRTFSQGGRTFVLGEPGSRYSLRLHNDSGQRVEAVVTVDGRDVISGRVGDFVNNRGYIVPPHGSLRIEGFRQSLERVAAFRFTPRGNSYSARMGTPDNIGVVGVAFFEEERRRIALRPHPHDHRRWPSADAEGGPPPPRTKRAPAREHAHRHGARDGGRFNIGTEYGETRFSPVSTTSFERRNHRRPDRILTLHYDDARGLEARGIRVFPPHDHDWPAAPPVEPRPTPFPHNRFAPPPR